MNKFLSIVAVSIFMLSSNIVLAMGETESGKLEMTTNKDVWGGQWKHIKGKFEEKFGKLIDNEDMIEHGNREQIVGLLQKQNGWTQVHAEKELDQFVSDHKSDNDDHGDHTVHKANN